MFFIPPQDAYVPLKRVTIDGTPMLVSLSPPIGVQCASCLWVQPLPKQTVKRDWRGNVKGVMLSLSYQQHDISCPYRKGTHGETVQTT